MLIPRVWDEMLLNVLPVDISRARVLDAAALALYEGGCALACYGWGLPDVDFRHRRCSVDLRQLRLARLALPVLGLDAVGMRPRACRPSIAVRATRRFATMYSRRIPRQAGSH